jgi:hypothetical protein
MVTIREAFPAVREIEGVPGIVTEALVLDAAVA